jgi:hypothetical protein
MQFAAPEIDDSVPNADARPPYTALDFVADQLRAANPGGDWNSNGVDRARELGAILLRNGILELSKLGATRLEVTSREYPWSGAVTRTEIALTYNGKTFGYLGTPTEPKNDPFLENYVRVAWSAEGHGHVDYLCRFTPQGFTIVPQWGSSSDWGTFREIVRFFVTVYLMYLSAGTASGAGATVGGTIMGAGFAAAYPALTAIIGNIAIGAYFSGGDVKSAVKNVLISQIAGAAGDFAGQVAYTATQIEILASLADVAVTALASGRDVETAVKMSLLQRGFSSVGEMLASTGENIVNDYESIDVTAYPVDGDAYSPDVLPVVDSIPSSAGAAPDWQMPQFAELPPVTFDPGPPINGSDVPAFTPSGDRISQPIRTTDSGGAVAMVNSLSALALNALKLNQAWNQARNPAPVTQARRVTGSAVTSGNDAGVIITRGADGTVTATRPPVGVPQATTNGNFIVNNGDDTYTIIAPDGSRRVVAYGQNAGNDPASLPWPLILAGAGLLISVFK